MLHVFRVPEEGLEPTRPCGQRILSANRTVDRIAIVSRSCEFLGNGACGSAGDSCAGTPAPNTLPNSFWPRQEPPSRRVPDDVKICPPKLTVPRHSPSGSRCLAGKQTSTKRANVAAPGTRTIPWSQQIRPDPDRAVIDIALGGAGGYLRSSWSSGWVSESAVLRVHRRSSRAPRGCRGAALRHRGRCD
jgi:hypothetical protein